MTFEARVKTVDAIEPVDFLDCAPGSARRVVYELAFSESPARCSLRFLRMTNHQIRKVIIATAAIPPTTPPAIAPVFVPPPSDELSDELEELLEDDVSTH